MDRSKQLDTFWRAAGTDSLDISRSAKGNPILSGELAVFNEWTEIRSPFEGHFMERIAPSAFKKTINERVDRIRVLFQHGRDSVAGDKPLGQIRDMPNDGKSQRYNVELFNVSYVNDLLPALEAGQFGSSFSARDIRSSETKRPERSDFNPERLPEVTREELMLREFGPVTFPAYESATAGLRSVTDDFLQPGLQDLLAALGWKPPVLRAETLEPEEPEPEAEADEPPAEPDPASAEGEPPHSEEEQTEEREEELPSWQLRR